MNLNKIVKKFKNNKRISDFWISPEINLDRQDSVWYGGDILNFTVDGRFKFYVDALGDNKIVVAFPPDADIEFLVDKNNAGLVGKELLSYNITKDEEIQFEGFNYFSKEDALKIFKELPEKKCVIYFEDGNWFNIEIYDSLTDKHHDFMDNLSNIDEVLSLLDIKLVDECIELILKYEE